MTDNQETKMQSVLSDKSSGSYLLRDYLEMPRLALYSFLVFRSSKCPTKAMLFPLLSVVPVSPLLITTTLESRGNPHTPIDMRAN